ncbi:MAG: hypothetical protein NWS66_01550 [Saprospiraceae bacterium]|nr:hypothetical protein [Saprospiraceae bacterium]MDP5049172.1 hypothetical protein [Saprospiraceae bacterium]
MAKKEKKEPVLYIYSDRSILVNEEGVEYKFQEGKTSDEAKKRLVIIKKALENGFLENIIAECQNPEVKIENISEEQARTIESLVNSVTSEVGRAIVGLTILQLTVKSILPEQSIRLHKGGSGTRDFSWTEGIPMRNLDTNYITPVLRKFDLLKINKFGFMMTRTLAENYPYSKLYKAGIRGARKEWLEITDEVELNELDSLNALKQMLVFLNNKSEAFELLTTNALRTLGVYLKQKPSFEDCITVISNFIDKSTYSARVFEVSLHAFFQVLAEEKNLEGFLKPLSQMRSANKKHGNIGDIEITESEGNMDIIEAWDAKFGKTYLREELEELNDKLIFHPQATIAGFVTDQKPNLKAEINARMKEIEEIHGTEIRIMEFREWVIFQVENYDLDTTKIGEKWLIAIAESICQKRREITPIDEPTTEWVESFIECII